MPVRNLRLAFCGGLLLLASPANAETLLCPPKATIASVKLANVPDGWTTEVPGHSIELFSARFYDGPPHDKGELKPEYWPEKNGNSSDVFSFAGPPAPKGMWLSCDYGAGQVVSLAKRIPDSIKECTVHYKKKKGDLKIDTITCKSNASTSSK